MDTRTKQSRKGNRTRDLDMVRQFRASFASSPTEFSDSSIILGAYMLHHIIRV